MCIRGGAKASTTATIGMSVRNWSWSGLLEYESCSAAVDAYRCFGYWNGDIGVNEERRYVRNGRLARPNREDEGFLPGVKKQSRLVLRCLVVFVSNPAEEANGREKNGESSRVKNGTRLQVRRGSEDGDFGQTGPGQWRIQRLRKYAMDQRIERSVRQR